MDKPPDDLTSKMKNLSINNEKDFDDSEFQTAIDHIKKLFPEGKRYNKKLTEIAAKKDKYDPGLCSILDMEHMKAGSLFQKFGDGKLKNMFVLFEFKKGGEKSSFHFYLHSLAEAHGIKNDRFIYNYREEIKYYSLNYLFIRQNINNFVTTVFLVNYNCLIKLFGINGEYAKYIYFNHFEGKRNEYCLTDDDLRKCDCFEIANIKTKTKYIRHRYEGYRLTLSSDYLTFNCEYMDSLIEPHKKKIIETIEKTKNCRKMDIQIKGMIDKKLTTLLAELIGENRIEKKRYYKVINKEKLD